MFDLRLDFFKSTRFNINFYLKVLCSNEEPPLSLVQTITWIVGNPSLWSQTNRVPNQTEESNLSDCATCWLTYLRPQRWLFSLFLEIVIMIIISIRPSTTQIYRILNKKFENYVSLIILAYIFVRSRKVFRSSVTTTENCSQDILMCSGWWQTTFRQQIFFENTIWNKTKILFKNLWFCKDFIVRLK